MKKNVYEAQDMLKQLFKVAIKGNRVYGPRATETMLNRTIMRGIVSTKNMETELNILSKAGFIEGRSVVGDIVELRLTQKGYQHYFKKIIKR
jgi:hypothetical protein